MEGLPGGRRALLSELGGLLLLAAGLGALGVGAGLVASCLRLGSAIEFLLATYVLAWAWLVFVALAFSPPELLTRGGLLTGIGVGLAAALAAWLRAGRPYPPPLGPPLRAAGDALRRPALAVLAVAVLVGLAYSVVLAVFTPANEGDALAYHLARAAFWKQEHGLGYIANAVDTRLNGNPPNAEIGQLATMLLSGSDRYVALPQLVAYGALVLCVAGLARRLGLGVSEALFAALAFAALPIVAVQASGALNDLVVASFLAVAVLFALGGERRSLVLFALALALALGTKLTAVLALPTLALVLALSRSRREWPGLALAGLAGLALGSAWYVVNLVETRELDGGLADEFDQRLDLSVAALIVNGLRFGLDFVDMSGAAPPYHVSFLVAAGVLAALGLQRLRRSREQGIGLLVAALVTALPYFSDHFVAFAQDQIIRTWAAVGHPVTPPFERGWNLNVEADTVASWFGPLGLLLLVAGTIAVLVDRRRQQASAAALAFALAPWVLLLSLLATIVWDPFRGRFLVFGVALAAATWGYLLRYRAVAPATAALAMTALVLSLVNYLGKPAGLDAIWARDDPAQASLKSIWRADRIDAQTRLRPRGSEEPYLRFVADAVPAESHIAVAVRENDYLFPYFGERLTRQVSLVPPTGGEVAAEADWLALSPGASVRRCEGSWRTELELPSGWRLERRVAPDDCPGSA